MKYIAFVLVLVAGLSFEGLTQPEFRLTGMGNATYDSLHLGLKATTPSIQVEAYIPLGKSPLYAWGFGYADSAATEGVVGLLWELEESFGVGIAAGLERYHETSRGRFAALMYYDDDRSEFSVYLESYANLSSLWYQGYCDYRFTRWLKLGVFMQTNSGMGGRITFMIPRTPVSIWAHAGHKGMIAALMIRFPTNK